MEIMGGDQRVREARPGRARIWATVRACAPGVHVCHVTTRMCLRALGVDPV